MALTLTQTLTPLMTLMMAAALFGCQPTGDGEESNTPATGADSPQKLLLPGKADNYYSNVAAEFEASGRMFVKLVPGEDRDVALDGRLTAAGVYLTTYLTDKFEGIDIDNDGEIGEDEVFFRNVDYGGFKAMVRNGSVEEEDIEEGDGGVWVNFTIDVAGPLYLDELLVNDGGMYVDGPGSDVRFDLAMPTGATSNPEDVNSRPLRNFDPSMYTGELEAVPLTVSRLPEISDAYPHYKDFVADGVYDITMMFGYDYNMPRADLTESRETFEHLIARGFKSPVDTYEELGADSGPFLKEILFDGEPVTIEVRLFHGDMFIDARAAHNQLTKDELVARDVFFYNGHAGPYFGLYLDANSEADVSYQEVAELDFPAKQQLFVAQGCQTYSQYADMLYANPNKSEDNLDAITTINYSYGLGTLELFDDLTLTDADDTFVPVTFYGIISRLNEISWNDSEQVFYGVMGIDGNAQLHPYARPDLIGQPCESDLDCGSSTANVCVSTYNGDTCAAVTLTESACPEGTDVGQLDYDDYALLVCYK